MHQLPKNTPTTTQPTQVIQSLTIFVFFGKLIGFAAAFLIGFLFITFFPLYMQRLVSTAKKNFWTNFGVGLATAFVTPLIILLLFLTLIGIPLALFVGVLFAYSLYAARIIVAIVIGEWATGYFSKKIHMVWALFCRTFYL